MYVKQDCKILFYRKLKSANQDGLVPLYVRITIDGVRDEISTALSILAINSFNLKNRHQIVSR